MNSSCGKSNVENAPVSETALEASSLLAKESCWRLLQGVSSPAWKSRPQNRGSSQATKFVSCGAPQGLISPPQLPPVPAQPILSWLTVLEVSPSCEIPINVLIDCTFTDSGAIRCCTNRAEVERWILAKVLRFAENVSKASPHLQHRKSLAGLLCVQGLPAPAAAPRVCETNMS